MGVVPWLKAAARLPSEDAVVLEKPSAQLGARMVVACPILPRISNFDDLDPLKLEPGVELRMVPPGSAIPAEAGLVVLAGSKASIADMQAMREEGWDIDILAHHRRGGRILGICGGYQMLGRVIDDPEGVEGAPARVAGLGLLNVETRMTGTKALRAVSGEALGARFRGYEMHMGESHGPDTARPFGRLADGRMDGAINPAGNVMGSYVHGLLGEAALRTALLARLGVPASGADYAATVDDALDEIAAGLESHLDVEAMIAIARAG